MQGLAAVEATTEGDEDGSVGSPHSRPGWAGPAKRVLYFYQAPGPDPAHYHQGSSGPSRPGWEGRGEGGGGEGQGGGEGEGGESVSLPLETKRPRGQETETATQTEREIGRGGELERVRNGEAGGETESKGRQELRTGVWEGQNGGKGSGHRDGRGMWGPIESEMEKSL